MTKAAFFNSSPKTIERVYAKGRRERVAELTELYPEIISADNFAAHAEKLRDIEVIFSTWGMPTLDAEHLELLPNLQALFYAAGSVKGFAAPLLRRGITVMSAWGANAVPVAEYTLGLILLACKGFFRNTRECSSPEEWPRAFRGPGVFGETVAILGCGMTGGALAEMLKAFELDVVAYDPYLSDERAAVLGVRKVSLEEAFKRAFVVTCHIANLPATQKILTRSHFASMRENATFINCGRGAQVVEKDLIGVLKERPDLTALLDVTDPEPPAEGSELYALPNVRLSSHIAGSIGDEVVRMADYCIDEFLAWRDGRELKHAVTLEMLETMA